MTTMTTPEPVGPPPPDWLLLDPTPVALGGPRGLPVGRTLPHRLRRMVGPWCFLDAFGPVDLDGDAAGRDGDVPARAGGVPGADGEPPVSAGAAVGQGMQVAPHPHTGLQTASWLVEGEILHRDSVGSLQLVRAGQLNLMTAGRGISHSEQTPDDHGRRLHGVQLWVALPDAARFVDPRFEHHGDLPVLELAAGAARVVVIAGQVDGVASAARVHSPLVAAEITLAAGADVVLPLTRDFEHAVLALTGTPLVGDDAQPLGPGPLLYVGGSRDGLRLRAEETSRVLLIGGEPLGEDLVMWWNFVGRSHDEIVAFREAWQRGEGFGEVVGYPGDRLPAPALPTVGLKPRGAVPHGRR